MHEIYNGHHHKSRKVCFTFKDDLISHCQTITGGLDIVVSGFNAQVKINMS